MLKSHGGRQKSSKKRSYKVIDKIVEENGMILIQTNQPKSKKFFKTLGTITVISPEEDCLIDVETLVKDEHMEQESETYGKRNSLNDEHPSISHTKLCGTCSCELKHCSCAICDGGASELWRKNTDSPVLDSSIINENDSQQTSGNDSTMRYIRKVFDLEKINNTNDDNIQGLLNGTIKMEPVDFDDQCDSVRILYQDSHELHYVEHRIKLEPEPELLEVETGLDMHGVDKQIEVHPESSLYDSWINNSPGFGAVNSHQTIWSDCIQATTSGYRETPKTCNKDKQEHIVGQSDGVRNKSNAKVGSDEIGYTYFHESGFVVFNERFGTRFVNVFSCLACQRVYIFISEVQFNHDRNYCNFNCGLILKSHAIHTLTDFQQCKTCSNALKYVAQCLLQRETMEFQNSSVKELYPSGVGITIPEKDHWKCSVQVISKIHATKSLNVSSKTPAKLRNNSYSIKKKSHMHVSLKTFENISPLTMINNSYSMKSQVSPEIYVTVCPPSLRKTNSEIENSLCEVPVISKAPQKTSSIKVNHSYSEIPFVCTNLQCFRENKVENVSCFQHKRSTRKQCLSLKQYESQDVQCSLQVINCSVVIPRVDECLTERRSCDMCNKQYIQIQNLYSVL